MGQTIVSPSDSYPKKEENIVNKNRFEFLNIIGRGGFGKVWKVIDKRTKTHYALKEMQKSKIIDKKSIKSIKYERELLSKLHHCFIVNMHYAFQDYDNLYLVIDLLTGGDLRYHVSRHRKFSEDQTKFFIACIIIALEYIHSNHIIHRDIKPENLVLDDKGYVKLTDFGIANQYTYNNSHETSGTPGYMSPEVLQGQNHGYAADYYAIGVIGYEFMLGKRPYTGRTRKDFKEQIMVRQAQIKEEEVPYGWHIQSSDFINRLLQRKQEVRIGFKGITEIKDHPWFKAFPWSQLSNGQLRSPFIPQNNDNFDKTYCEAVDKQGLETRARYNKYKMSNNYSDLFKNYTFISLNKEQPNKESNCIPSKQNEHSQQRCQSALKDQIKQKESTPKRDHNKSYQSVTKILTQKNNDDHYKPLDKQIKIQKKTERIETKKPIPISHNKQYIRSMSNMCISPYMMHKNKNKTIDIESSSSMKNKEHPSEKAENSLQNKKLNNNQSNQPNKKDNNLPKRKCRFGDYIYQAKYIDNNEQMMIMNKLIKNIKPNSGYTIKEKNNPTVSLSVKMKSVKINTFTLNSTGTSAKFPINIKEKE